MRKPEFSRVDLAAQPILFIQRRASQAELQTAFVECFPKAFGHALKSGLSIAGQPIARYISVGPGLMTVDCAIPVSGPASSDGEIKADTLPAGPAAKAVHWGAYEKLAETTAALQRWMEANNFEPVGRHWESYVTDPAEVPNPDDWQTDIFWPISG